MGYTSGVQSIDKIRDITDPRKRAESAARLVQRATERVRKARDDRDLALVTLHRGHGWTSVACYQLAGMVRSSFEHIRDEFPAVLPGTDASEDELVATVQRAGAELAEWDAAAKQARPVRDDAARALLAGFDNRAPMTGAEVARLTGLTRVRIHQLRDSGKLATQGA